jgi:hypothetical protein
VIGYGQTRHFSGTIMSELVQIKSTLSVFDETIELLDLQEVVRQLYFTALSAKAERRDTDAERPDHLLQAFRAAMSAVKPVS